MTEWGLGIGESEVLALARARGRATAVLDDAQARSCARALGVPPIGRLEVVLRAATDGRITAAAPVLRDLVGAGLHLDDAVIREALRAVLGEEWG